MLLPIKVTDIELSNGITTIEGLEGFMGLQGLVRLFGNPIGYIHVSVTNGFVSSEVILKEIFIQHSEALLNHFLQAGLSSYKEQGKLSTDKLATIQPHAFDGDLPSITVAVCTRDRSDDLTKCLNALCLVNYPFLEILVIDNAPSTNSTENLIKNNYPNIRYVTEIRPGLDFARNRAIMEATGEIIAFTDDDVIVDAQWVKAFAELFADNNEVMAATGLVIPYELETKAQILFEQYGGFGRGFTRKWRYVEKGQKVPWQLLGTGQYGTGANMAFRRSLFNKIGFFDPALDVGTISNGGGDLEMFFRVIKEGYMFVYEPKAIVRHRHRREYKDLKKQIENNGSLFTYFVFSSKAYPDTLSQFLKLGFFWMRYWNIGRLITSFFNPVRFPKDLILAELNGGFKGLTKYKKAKKNSEKIISEYGNNVPEINKSSASANLTNFKETNIGVRMVEITQPIEPLEDVTNYSAVRVYISQNGRPAGKIDIKNKYQNISKSRLIEEIAAQMGTKILPFNPGINDYHVTVNAIEALRKHFISHQKNMVSTGDVILPKNVLVSVVVSTYNRPEGLRLCIQCLQAQQLLQDFEIIIVDNCPSSGLTAPVVYEFSNIMLVNEPRQGLAYARNAGIIASRGKIIATTDDDVIMEKDWLQKLITPFCREDVMSVTGNVLPAELTVKPQQMFEEYGGLGRGFKPLEANGKWFSKSRYHSVHVWELGATANAAFRSSIFKHPQIGLMDEALGPGMPSGVGEDSYLFYKILKAGYTISYHPDSFVWHSHRSSMAALRKQIFNYSKGHVSHHLTTYLRDKDFRGIAHIFYYLPKAHLIRIIMSVLGMINYPVSMILLEIWGNMLGPWALYRSRLRVKREGKSTFDNPPIIITIKKDNVSEMKMMN